LFSSVLGLPWPKKSRLAITKRRMFVAACPSCYRESGEASERNSRGVVGLTRTSEVLVVPREDAWNDSREGGVTQR
jgi:hypothetical protein